MKTQLFILALISSLTAGCVVSIGGKHETPPPAMPPGPPPSAAETATAIRAPPDTQFRFRHHYDHAIYADFDIVRDSGSDLA